MTLSLPLEKWCENHIQTLLNHPFSHSIFLFSTVLFLFWANSFRVAKSQNLPPSPPKLPIIGHLHKLGSLPHQSLRILSQKYGPLMLLRLGYTPTVVVSSARIATEVMKTHDITFSNRPIAAAVKIFLYGGKDVGFPPYGEYWKKVRKMCVMDLLSVNRVKSYRFIRDEEIGCMVNKIKHAAATKSDVNVSDMIINATYSIISRICLGRTWGGEGESEYAKLTKEVNDVFGLFAVEDMFPSLGWIDRVTGVRKRMKKVSAEIHGLLNDVIKEHHMSNSKADRKDFVDLMLEYERDPTRMIEFNHENLRAILLDMFVAGTDTVYTTIDWAMAELISHPKVLIKLQEKIRSAIGTKSEVDENITSEIDYLNCVIKETLRLHPPAALSIPRISSASAEIDGYCIPAHTRTIINLFAIQRDPEMWDKPDEFIPERFEDNPIDFRGNDFEFIPFGAGRKGCPAITFSITSVESVLANMLYWFDWELTTGEVDMTENYGVSVRRKFPLRLIPVTYLP